MTEAPRYCQRCGEEPWYVYSCGHCHGEFCSDCATNRDGYCPECWEKLVAEERAEAERAKYPTTILPAMRKWVNKQLKGVRA